MNSFCVTHVARSSNRFAFLSTFITSCSSPIILFDVTLNQGNSMTILEKNIVFSPKETCVLEMISQSLS